jgi:hypothetical protein
MLSFARNAFTVAVVALAACNPVTPADDDTDLVDAATFDGPVDEPDAGPDAMVDPCAGNVELDDYFGCLKNVWCDLIQECIGWFADEMDCDAIPLQFFDTYGDRVDAVLLAELVAEGRVQYDPAAAGACVQNLDSFDCVTALTSNENPLRTCGAFTGTLNEGSACYHPLECAGEGSRCLDQFTNCSEGMACCTGTCQRAATLGSDCSTRRCEPGTYCVNSVCEAGATALPVPLTPTATPRCGATRAPAPTTFSPALPAPMTISVRCQSAASGRSTASPPGRACAPPRSAIPATRPASETCGATSRT